MILHPSLILLYYVLKLPVNITKYTEVWDTLTESDSRTLEKTLCHQVRGPVGSSAYKLDTTEVQQTRKTSRSDIVKL